MVLALAILVSLGYMGHEWHQEVYSRVSGRVVSIELAAQPADPNDTGDYVVHFVSADGRETIAPCSWRLCDKVRPGDTISADLVNREGRLAAPVKITYRP